MHVQFPVECADTIGEAAQPGTACGVGAAYPVVADMDPDETVVATDVY